MSVSNGTRRQSWRQSGSRKPATGGSLARRRMITTALLMCLLLGAIALVAYLFNRRYQHTRLASLFSASRTQTGEPEQAYTWLPLRFGTESLAPLLAQLSPQLELASLTTNSDNAQNLVAAIESQTKRLERNDALILWIRAKGASLAGKAYLLSGDYHLPQSGEQISAPQGAIPFKTIVDAVSAWQGPSLILLDWGNQLSDPRAGMWDNQFLYWAMSDIAAAPPQVHCLISHQAGELSLDSLAAQQTLFGRACAEAIVGPRRAPPEFSPEVQADRSLLVGDLAEYVIRRVWADSAETQKPWLAKGKVGWIEAERKNWDSLTTSAVLQLTAQRRPLGWTAIEPADPAADNAADSQAAKSADQSDHPSPPVTALTNTDWPTGVVWQTLDQWQTPSDKLGGWSMASLAPLTARRIATMALDLEHRWLAGVDFRGDASGAILRARVKALQAELQTAESEIERAAQTGAFSIVLAPPSNDVSPGEIANWRRRIETIANYRKLALSLSDTVALSDSISKRKDVSGDLRQAAGRGIEAAKTFLVSVSTSSATSIDNLSPSDAASLTRDLKNSKEQIDDQIARLVERAIRNPLQERPLAELLSRYGWLTHAQRNSLLLSMLSATPLDANRQWPTMDLSVLQAPPPQLNQEARPQSMDLVEAALPQLFDGSPPALTSAQDLVGVLSKVAQEVRAANQVSEAQWLVADGRDLCQKVSGWPVAAQQPPLPAAPQPLPSWRVAWEEAVGGQLTADRLLFNSTSQPASVDLLMTRVGAAENIDSIQIALNGVEGRIGGEDTPWQRGSMQLAQSDLLRVVDLKANAQRLPIEIRALSNDPQTKRELQVRVSAGTHSPPEQILACQLPVATPVALVVQQRVCREGLTRWENCDQRGTLFTLQPFPGRQTEFRLLVSNQDSQARSATVELYRLNSRSGNNAKGRISQVGEEVPLELEKQDLRSFTSLARSAAIDLTPNQRDVDVDFSASPAEPATATAEKSAAATPSDSATSQADISWGMLAVVRLKSEPTQAWRSWIQLDPVLADDFLSTQSKATSNGRTIEMIVSLKDANQNGLPDWTPTDFTDEHPIAVECIIGEGIDLRQATLPTPEQVLTKDKPSQLFTISSESRIENEVELQLNVDGSIRAMFEFVGVGGRAARREPPDRLWLRSIAVKDGLSYLNGFKRNLADNERLLDKFGAMFRRPVTGSIELVLAVDTQSRRLVGAPPIPVDFQLTGPTWEHSFGHFYGARDLHARLVDQPGKTLSIACQLTDWTFEFDPRSLGDVTAIFRGTAGASGEQTLAKLTLDGLGPVLAQPVPAQQLLQGKDGLLKFAVDESVPIGQAKILIGPAGKPGQAASLIEGLSSKDFEAIQNGWQLRAQTLPVQEFPPGRYDLSVQIDDILGNPSTFGPWELTIQPKPLPGGTPANGSPSMPLLKGDINGRLFFGAANRLSPNPVKVTIKDHPDKTTSSSDGKFTIAGLEAGEYTVEAQTQWQGADYKGEAKVKLAQKADYQKLIEITLAK